MDQEIKEILTYHSKLLEQIIISMDESRHNAGKQKEVVSNITQMIFENPMLNSNPQAKEFMSNIAGSLKAFSGKGES
jgi:hypothetical protein